MSLDVSQGEVGSRVRGSQCPKESSEVTFNFSPTGVKYESNQVEIKSRESWIKVM